jgi:putative transposase
VTDQAVTELAPRIGVRGACGAVGASQAGYYRRHRISPAPERPAPIPHRGRRQPRALSEAEQHAILGVLHSNRFAGTSPAEVWATLLDEGVYLGSQSTFCRLLRAAGEMRERRAQAAHPAKAKPELVASAPNQVWSWDITKLRGPAKWTYYYLYVIIDIFSRYVTGWMVASRESAGLAEVLIRQTCAKQAIGRDQLTIHAGRGSSMTSKPVAFLLADLGITQSHSRPHVSNDNPFSESQFKTLKYRPGFPRRFGSIQAARLPSHRQSVDINVTPIGPRYGGREASRSSPAHAGERRAPGPPRAGHRSTVRVVADRSADRARRAQDPGQAAHLSPAVNVVLRHVRCPTLQKWPSRPTKIDRSRSIRVEGYGPLLH